MALFKHQILKIHPSMITSDSFILSKMLLKQWEKKGGEAAAKLSL